MAAGRRRRGWAGPGPCCAWRWCLNVAADRRRPRLRRRGQAHRHRPPASTWPPTVVGGDGAGGGAGGDGGLPASTWPPTVVGGDTTTRRKGAGRDEASTWPPTVVGGDRSSRTPATSACAGFNVAADRRRRRRAPRRPFRTLRAVASTWPPTVVGGDPPRRRSPSRPSCSFNVAADRRRRRRACSSPAAPRGRRFNVAADRRRRRLVGVAFQPLQAAIASTWPPTVVGGDVHKRDVLYTSASASTWPPTVVGGDQHGSRRDPDDRPPLQRGRRPSSAETIDPLAAVAPSDCCFNVAADRRRRRPSATLSRARQRSRFNVAADRRRRRRGRQPRGRRPRARASTWPPTVVGGDRRVAPLGVPRDEARQRGRRPSSAETAVEHDRVPGQGADASTWPPTVVGGDVERLEERTVRRGASTWPPTVVGGDAPGTACSSSSTPRSFNVAADRRRRRPNGGGPRPHVKDRLQRGRRPSSAETTHNSRARGGKPKRLQRGRRPSSAETRRATGPPPGHAAASTWPPTVVGGDVARRRPRSPHSSASTWPPTVVGGDVLTDDTERSVALPLQRGRRPSSAETSEPGALTHGDLPASTWPPTVVGGDPSIAAHDR